MFEIQRYTPDKESLWNEFLTRSKNGSFLFNRAYMDYHSDRFTDHSLMVYKGTMLYALLPANAEGKTWWTHQGLTYGGLVMSDKCRAAMVRELFIELNDYLRMHGFNRVVYKHIPWHYCQYPAEEDSFALTNVCHAFIRSRDVASVVMLHHPLSFSTLRRRGVKKAVAAGVQMKEVQDLAPFWQLLEENLWTRFHSKPVHTLSEIQLLQRRFAHNIRLFVVFRDERLLGGTLLYVSGQTVKTQYISANEEGKQVGALDYLFEQLMLQCTRVGKQYFDFGTSNLTNNDDLNDPLIFQKEGFGARAVCYDTYEWSL